MLLADLCFCAAWPAGLTPHASSQNNGSSPDCFILPHQQRDETAPYEDDGAGGRIDSLVRGLMAKIDEDYADCLESEQRAPQQQLQQQRHQEEEEEEEEEEKEKETMTATATTFSSVAQLPAVFMDRPAGEAFGRAMTLAQKMMTSTKDAMAHACAIAVQNQVCVSMIGRPSGGR